MKVPRPKKKKVLILCHCLCVFGSLSFEVCVLKAKLNIETLTVNWVWRDIGRFWRQLLAGIKCRVYWLGTKDALEKESEKRRKILKKCTLACGYFLCGQMTFCKWKKIETTMNLPGVKCERWLVPYGDAPLFLQDVALCFCGAAPPCPVLKPLSLITSHFLPHLFKFPKVTVTKALPPLILLESLIRW